MTRNLCNAGRGNWKLIHLQERNQSFKFRNMSFLIDVKQSYYYNGFHNNVVYPGCSGGCMENSSNSLELMTVYLP